jgi:hypothetical protein
VEKLVQTLSEMLPLPATCEQVDSLADGIAAAIRTAKLRYYGKLLEGVRHAEFRCTVETGAGSGEQNITRLSSTALKIPPPGLSRCKIISD